MIDIKILRNNPEIIEKTLKNKVVKNLDLKMIIELDNNILNLRQELDKLRENRNKLSFIMSQDKNKVKDLLNEAKIIKQNIQEIESNLSIFESDFITMFKKIPNIATDDTPIWYSEEENQIVFKYWEIPNFDFPVKNHAEIAIDRWWLDKERASNVAWSRFAYLKWDLVKLQFALINWVIDLLWNSEILSKIIKDKGLNISDKAFVPVLPPYMIKTSVYDAMDRLEPQEDRYKIEWQDLWLQWSAEHVLGSMHANEIFNEKDLPIRYIWYATSFRWEAGTYWKDMEGIIRMHQFDKLEMESFSLKESSHEEHLFFSAIQEYMMQELKIPYQKLQKCTFDIWKPNAKWSDIEAWLPWQNKYRETHTADYMTDYQSRRLQTRVRRENWDLELIHTNDATAFACGRILVAIIENYQKSDWSVAIPEVLRAFMWNKDSI